MLRGCWRFFPGRYRSTATAKDDPSRGRYRDGRGGNGLSLLVEPTSGAPVKQDEGAAPQPQQKAVNSGPSAHPATLKEARAHALGSPQDARAWRGDRRGAGPPPRQPRTYYFGYAGLSTLQCSKPALRDAREAVPETNDSAVQGRGDDAVDEIARELVARTGRTLHHGGAVGGWGRAEKPTHRGREIVRLRVGLTPFRTRNFVRRDPM